MAKALFLLVPLTAAMIWILLIPSPLPPWIEIQREQGYIAHIAVFAAFSVACLLIFPKRIHLVTTVLFFLAICLEIAQIPIPGRDADIVDLAMNGLGVALGSVIFRTLRRNLKIGRRFSG